MSILRSCLFIASLAANACRESAPLPPRDAHALIVTPNAISLSAGGQVQLAAQANDANGHPVPEAPIRFGSGDEARLSVSERGLVSALGTTGRSIVRVRSGALVREIPVTIRPGEPASLSKESGDLQQAEVTRALPQTAAVTVRDALGNAIPGARVVFRAEKGSAEPSEATTNPSGLAETRWTLGQTAGEQDLYATVEGGHGTIETRFVASAKAGALARIEVVTPALASALVSTPVALRVRASDEHGNAQPAVAVLWQVVEGGGVLAAAVSETDADGVATADWRLGERVDMNAVIAMADGLPGHAARIEIATHAGMPAGLLPLPHAKLHAAALRVVDAFGNPVPGVLVRFRCVKGAGSVSNEAAMTDDGGVAGVQHWAPDSVPAELEARIQGDLAPLVFERTATAR